MSTPDTCVGRCERARHRDELTVAANLLKREEDRISQLRLKLDRAARAVELAIKDLDDNSPRRARARLSLL